MGVVYGARDERLGRQVAIKVLPAAVIGDADRLRRFEQEARTVGGLNHPNLVILHDVGRHEGAPYLVTELLSGTSLRARIAESPLGLREVVRIAGEVAHGLNAAHGSGIVHRDIKPDNIFLTRDGRVKILDFGIAKLRDVDAGTAATAATMASRIGADIEPCISSPSRETTRSCGVIASGSSRDRSIDVPLGPLVLAAMRENTMVFTKLIRRMEVEVVKIANSGPRTPPLPAIVPAGEK